MKKILCASLFIFSTARANAIEAKEMFAKSETAIHKFIPRAYLAYYKGKKSESLGCTDKVEWRFVFKEDESRERPMAAGFIDYTYAEIDGVCSLKERTVVDTDINIAGYSYLANKGNLEKVNLEWDDALKRAQEKHPTFDWLNSFEVYSPLTHTDRDRIFYALLGALDGKPIEILVDASTGAVVDLLENLR